MKKLIAKLKEINLNISKTVGNCLFEGLLEDIKNKPSYEVTLEDLENLIVFYKMKQGDK